MTEIDSLDEFLSSLSWTETNIDKNTPEEKGLEKGVEATAALKWADFSNKVLAATTIITTTTAPTSTHNSSHRSNNQDEFGFPIFATLPNASASLEEEGGYHQVIECTQSFSGSLSTMTHHYVDEDKELVVNNNINNKSNTSTSNKSRKRSSSAGIQKALSKLALCGQSAKEDSMDLEYAVFTLRQAITAQEATTALRHMVKILKQGRGNKSSSLSTSELQEGLVAAGADHCVISTLWNFPSNVPVQYYGVIGLGELVAHSHLPNQKSIVLKGGIEVVLTAMKNHMEEESIQEEACRTLKNMMKYFDTAKQHVARHKGISRILQAMMTHPEYASVQRQACYALTSLSCLKSISDELVAKQGHAVLLKTMQHHNDDCFVLAESWRTLTNIVIHSMNCTLDEEIAAHGLDLVCQSLNQFADCSLVPIQARGVTLLTHLCYRSPANLERLTLTHNLEIIHHILRVCKYDDKVQAAGEKLVQQLSQAGYSLPQQQQRGRNSHRSKRPPLTAVISQIQNDQGLDVILDTTMY